MECKIYNKALSILVFYMFLVVPAYSQVGINTLSPRTGTVLHVDGKGDTAGALNGIDDVVIDVDGNVGVGTLTPQAKFDINGKLRFSDRSTTDFTDYILASDVNGNASWKDYLIALRYKTTQWSLENTNWPVIDASSNVFTLSGTSTLQTEVGAIATSTTLTLPKGRYLAFLTGELANHREYGELRLMNGSDIILKSNFMEELTGCAAYVEFTSDATLSFSFTIYDVNSNPAKQIPFLDAFPFAAPNTVRASVVLLGLDVGG